MAENDAEKTEDPTPRRRQEARQEGNVAKSQDLTAAVTLLVSVILLYVLGLKVITGMRVTLAEMLAGNYVANPTRADDTQRLFVFGGEMVLWFGGPLLAGIAVITLLATVMQVGFLLTGEPLIPNFGRLSPLKGLGNLFGARAGVRLIMGVAKVILIAAVATWIIRGDLPAIIGLAHMEAVGILPAAGALVFGLAVKLAALLLVLAIFDYAFQWWQRERDLRMSKQEVKEEMKRMDGDPLIKQRRARVARQLAMQRIGQHVPKADVIVTNPTHFAIALRYDPDTMKAPRVLAKGADELAMRIRQIAMAHGIPLVERVELARGLYKAVDPGKEVPPQFYGAVAEVLAYVYRLSGRKLAS